MPGFIHIADVHFDTPFSARFSPKQAEIRRKEIMQTFREIVALAGEKDFLLISGDLFDGGYVSRETINFLKRCFSSIPNTRVLISAGNHDPLTNNSVYNTEDWGKNVYIFDTELEYLDFAEIKTRVHGVSFGESRIEKPLFTNLSIKEGWNNILVIHGEVVGNNGESNYNPIQKGVLESCGADYVALGHIHKHSGIEKLGKTTFSYPGIPEGRGFDEDGEKGIIIGEINDNAVIARWQKTAMRSFIIADMDLSDCCDSLEVLEKISEYVKATGEENIYRIILTGNVKPDIVRVELLNDQLKGKAFHIEVRDETRGSYDLDEIAKEKGLRGDFVKAMQTKIAELPEEEKELGYMAIRIGLEAMDRGRDL